MIHMHELVEHDIRTLWDYMQMHQPPNKADCLLVISSDDDRSGIYAAELARKYHYWYFVVSGGKGHGDDLLATHWSEQACLLYTSSSFVRGRFRNQRGLLFR